MERKTAIAYKRKPKLITRAVLAPGESKEIEGLGIIHAPIDNMGKVFIGEDLSVRSELDMDSIDIRFYDKH